MTAPTSKHAPTREQIAEMLFSARYGEFEFWAAWGTFARKPYFDMADAVLGMIDAAADEVDRLRAKLDILGAHDMHLRAVIENAPHEPDCDMRLSEAIRIPEDKCTCWKRDAL